jgi:DNA processing protein
VVRRWDDAERATLVALLRLRPEGLSWSDITAEVDDAGSALAVWPRHVPVDLFDQFPENHPHRVEAALDVARWAGMPYRFLTFLDEAYPRRLLDVHQRPPFLFADGALVQDDPGVCVVGSRRATAAGQDLARGVATELVARSLTVVSGLAEGVDTAAHRAALEARGRTVAVIGTGIERCYPTQNTDLQRRIADTGLVLSQFWPSSPPSKHSFPMRNAIMSAYGHATIVVEAGESSGARIQARSAVEHGRPVVLFESVAAGTSWGRKLVGAPGTFVVRTPRETALAVEHILQTERAVTRLLSCAGT